MKRYALAVAGAIALSWNGVGAAEPTFQESAPSGQPAVVPAVGPLDAAVNQIFPTGWKCPTGPASSCADTGCGVGSCGEGCDTCGSCLDTGSSLFSGLKQQKLPWNDDITYSVGAALRHRHMNEENRLRPGVPAGGARATYDLWRLTPHLKLSYNDTVTGFVEAIDASAFGYDAPLGPVGIDNNRADLLRYYVELNLGDVAGGNLRYRYGRQFLKYGSQHLLSPLAWSNTFRNFEGHKLLWKSGDWSVDAFSMGSVNAAAGGSGFDDVGFDHVDSDRQIHGVYTSYSGLKNNVVDLYWLWSDEDNRAANRQDGDRHTVGIRVAGTREVRECRSVKGVWNWDLETAFQFGEDSFTAVAPGGVNQDVRAGFISALAGYTFSDVRWTPKVEGIFYWGSGDTNPANGENNTFYSLYPLGHAYWGLIDNFSGQNLIDYGVRTSIKPHKRVGLSAAFHWFDRATEDDAVYNIVGAPFAAGTPGKHIGNELDLLANLKVSETVGVQAGYFWFWYDDAISNSAQARPDASQFYLQTTVTY